VFVRKEYQKGMYTIVVYLLFVDERTRAISLPGMTSCTTSGCI
jgi:hypothetical protein